MKTSNEPVYFSVMPSPVGPLTITCDERSLTGVYFANGRGPVPGDEWTRDDARCAGAREQLEQYFRGERQTFDLPITLRGTPFQVKVWNALREIPFGTTVSYGALARAIGKPAAVRAVGAANGQNPICVIVPCHRVIGADGSLTGFGGGLPRKKQLLEHESPQLRVV